MAKYSAPGIYVEEIPHSPEIETSTDGAVFLGYTEKHENLQGENLCDLPTLIHSLREFELLFGFAQNEENLTIFDDSTATLEKISVGFEGSKSLHNLYYSLQAFFSQGASSCTIVSVGKYKRLGEPLMAEDFEKGLAFLQKTNNNFLIAVPESQNLAESDFYAVQQSILEYCARNKCFAILDLPPASKDNYREMVSSYREKLESPHLSYGSAFFPNLITLFPYACDKSVLKIKKLGEEFSLASFKTNNPLRYKKYAEVLTQFFAEVPPSAAVAAAFLKNDNDKGISKAPANIALQNVRQLAVPLSNSEQDFLTIDADSGKSINAIRNFTGRGNLIWGSRTLDGNSNEWRYIPTRRFANLLENDLINALKPFGLEENSQTIWTEIKNKTQNYLLNFWQYGALQGMKPAQGFFVRCGLGETMTAQDILEGNLLLEVGFAPARPAEFIVLHIQQKMA